MVSMIERARRYLAKRPPSISGQGGHNAAFHVAAVLVHGFALSEGDALRLMREWNTQCVPPWSEGELVHKIKSARNAKHSEPQGYLLGNDAGGERAGTRNPIQMPPKPKFCPMVLKRVAAKAAVSDVVSFLNERSLVPVDVQDPASVLRWLYPRSSGA
jgi:hypothetical protein